MFSPKERELCARNTPQPPAKFGAPARKLEGPLPRPSQTKPRQPLHVKSNFTRPQYLAAVDKAKSYIRAGDIFQVVPSQRFSAPTTADPFEIYRALRVVNPSPYLYFLKLNDVSVVGSSPEMLVKVQGRKVSYRPIAGTVPRGRNESEDQLSNKLCSPIPKSAPSTSCSSISAATTSAASANTAR